jgi:hypothetical protein
MGALGQALVERSAGSWVISNLRGCSLSEGLMNTRAKGADLDFGF